VRLEKLVGIFALLTAAAVVPASATIYDLTSDHCTGTCGTAPFGNIELLQDGTTVDVTVHLNSPNFFVKSGAGSGMAFIFNAVDVLLADISIDAHTPALDAFTGDFSQGSVGAFGFGIGCSSCGNGSGDSFNTNIVFHVANATIADLTAPNASGNVFVADIFSSNVGNLTGNGNTGLVDATVPRSSIPEPVTSGLVGTGLASLFFLRRRFADKA
jgi:hypothetical protein